jgi:hypothetical protein
VIFLDCRHLLEHRGVPAILVLSRRECGRLLSRAQVELLIIKHALCVPWRFLVPDEVSYGPETKRLTLVLGVDMRGCVWWWRDEAN